jgi:hypothetical protein
MLNFIIIAHKNPSQVLRLINNLRGNDNKFFIHIDKGVKIEDFKDLISGDDVFYVKKRYQCIWAHYNFVLATIACLSLIFDLSKSGKVILLSGQCYPLKSITKINDILSRDDGLSYMNLRVPEWKDFKRRITEYRIDFSNKRFDYIHLKTFNIHSIKLFFNGRINILQLLRLLRKRRIDMQFRGGSAWWILDYNSAKTIYDYYLKNKYKLNTFFKHSHCPDEFFFQTVVYKIWGEEYINLFEDSLVFVDWSKKGVDLPVTFNNDDYDQISNLPNIFLFARKFDIEKDSKILDMIDDDNKKE